MVGAPAMRVVHARSYDEIMPNYRLIDLFAGAGGLTRGFLDTGRFRSVAAVEHDRVAAATYAANFGRDHVFAEDIATWLERGAVPSAEVVVGGPPCQGFSNLGNKAENDPRNSLWREYFQVIREAKPLYFVIENVPQFLKSAQFAKLEARTMGRGKPNDYTLSHSVVDAADFGVPQHRKRAVVFGRLNDLPPLTPLLGNASRSTVRQALEGVAPEVTAVSLPSSQYEFDGFSFPGTFKTSQLHLARRPSQLSLDRYDKIPEGGNRFDIPGDLLPPCWKTHKSGSVDVMGRMSWTKPSVTIRTEFYKPEKGRYLHPAENRSITHYEAALLQTFPEDHVWCGSKTAIGRQIGNAVPPVLAHAIANHLLQTLVG